MDNIDKVAQILREQTNSRGVAFCQIAEMIDNIYHPQQQGQGQKEPVLTWGIDFDINGDLTPSGDKKTREFNANTPPVEQGELISDEEINAIGKKWYEKHKGADTVTPKAVASAYSRELWRSIAQAQLAHMKRNGWVKLDKDKSPFCGTDDGDEED